MISTFKKSVLYALAAIALAATLLLGLISWLGSSRAPHGASWQWNLPAHFPVPRVPADNPMSEEKFQLGRHLFYDKKLSGNGTMACASCHFQRLAFTDGKAVSTGASGMPTLRSAQTLANSAYHPFFTWANYSLVSIEHQMMVPLQGEHPLEMGLNDATLPVILQRFNDDENDVRRFKAAFPGEPMRLDHIVKAIAVFQRALISANSKYDRHLMQKAVFSEKEERGRALFFSGKAQCSQCHGSFNFNDQVISKDTTNVKMQFHNTGLYNVGGNGAFPEGNGGIAELSGKPEDMGMFRAASLRNIEVTAPYMHDGSIATLEQVLAFYAAGGRNIAEGPHQGDGRKNPNKDVRLNQITLNAAEQADIIAFLKTLTDAEFLSNPRFSDPSKIDIQRKRP
jgi:cytochrome c peroxidase